MVHGTHAKSSKPQWPGFLLYRHDLEKLSE
jgi:hypothetical protein